MTTGSERTTDGLPHRPARRVNRYRRAVERRVGVASWEPTERVVVPSAQQRWEALTFVHHAYPPGVVAGLLPPGVTPDTFDGRAWVGITPFRLHASVLPVAPGPRITRTEVNVRTYVRHPDGRDGLWFLTLDLDQVLVVAGLRGALRLPYRRASGAVEFDGDLVRYRTRRAWPHRRGALGFSVRVGSASQAPPDALTTFLVGRWRAFTEVAGRLLTVPVQHPPWPLAPAELTDWRSERYLEALGLPTPQDAPHVCFSPGVEVRLGFPRR